MLAKAPNRKRAEQYLAASGAVPISVTERATIHTGSKITGTVAARWWIAERDALRVANAARLCAGADRTYLRPSPAWRDQPPPWARR
jgi:hypothetical protein